MNNFKGFFQLDGLPRILNFEDVFNLRTVSSNHPSDVLPYKQLRITSMPSDIPVSVKTSKVSKLLSFPTPSPLPQEAHAPQRNSRVFRSSVRKSQPVQNQVKEMGNLVSIAEHWFLVKEAKAKALGYFQRQQYGEKTTVHASENRCLEGMSVEEYKRLVDGEFVSDQASTDVCLTELIKSDNLRSMVDYPLHKKLVREVAWPRRLPVYRKSYESSKKWDPNLSILKLEAELAQKKIAAFKFMGWIDEAEEVVPSEPFTPLTDEEDDCVNHALCGSNRRELLVVHENSNIDITREVIQCLKPRAWLNDEVINLYLELLKEREERDPKRFLKCHFFNTFFYKKLMGGKNGYDFKGVRRWTTHKKIGYSLINCDKVRLLYPYNSLYHPFVTP